MSLLFKKLLEKIKTIDNSKISYGKKYNAIDLNTINATEIGDFDTYCTNVPFANTGGYLITIVMSSSYEVQIAINASNGDNYQRLKVSGNWQSWVKK